MGDEHISDEEFWSLRGRLKEKQAEFLRALRSLAGRRDDSVANNLFRLLGIVTFWLSVEDKPTRARLAQVDEALSMLRVEFVRTDGQQPS